MKDIEKKMEQAKQIRDYIAYKELQKELDKEKAKKDKDDVNGMIEDANRKDDEKNRRWRQYYEDFAN